MALLGRLSIINGLTREFETVSKKKKSETRFFLPFWVQKCVFGDPGHKPDSKIRIMYNETPKRVMNWPANPIFWVSKLTRLDLRFQRVYDFQLQSNPRPPKTNFDDFPARRGDVRSWTHTILRVGSRICLPWLHGYK